MRLYGTQKTLEVIQASPEFQSLQASDEVLASSVLFWLKMANRDGQQISMFEKEISRPAPCCARRSLGYDHNSGCITCKTCYSRLTRPHSSPENAWDDFLTNEA